METIFALFDNYDGAREAVDALLDEGFEEAEMNAVAMEATVKESIDVDLKEVNVQKTDEVGQQTVHGLTQLFGGEQPVHVGGSGELLAGGELATILVTQAASTGTDAAPLRNALQEFGVPQDLAADFHSSIVDGGVLLWARVEDERANAAANALRAANGKHVGAYAGS